MTRRIFLTGLILGGCKPGWEATRRRVFWQMKRFIRPRSLDPLPTCHRRCEIRRLANSLPEFLHSAPRIAAVNDAAKKPERLPYIRPITTNVIF